MKRVFALLVLSLSLQTHALVIDLLPNKSSYNQGQSGGAETEASPLTLGSSFELFVNLSGFQNSSALALGAYDFNLYYDATRFAFSNLHWGDASLGNQLDLGGFGSIKLVDSAATGTLQVAELSLDSPWDLHNLQAKNFTVFSISFLTLLPGAAAFSLDINALSDAYGDSINDNLIKGVSVNIAPTSVPEPSSALLFFLGLVSILTIGKKVASRD